MTIKIFTCLLCKVKHYVGTRAGIRKHLKEEHFIKTEILNKVIDRNDKKKRAKNGTGREKQKWFKVEEVE